MRRGSTLIEEARNKRRKNMLLIGALIGVCILAVAVYVGVHTYFNTTNAKLDLAPSNAAESLVSVSGDQPEYVLCSADLGKADSAPASYDTPQNTLGLLLVRVDQQARKLTFAGIPANCIVKFPNGENHPLYTALDEGGEALLIECISRFADVDISHYIRTDANGIKAMVGLVGGLQMNLANDIDDPYSGNEVLFAGDVTLNGDQSIAYLRAMNVYGGLSAVMQNRIAFTAALIDKALASQGLDFAAIVSNASSYIDTDLKADMLLSMADSFRPFEGVQMWTCSVPGSYGTSSDGASVFEPSSKEWKTIRDRFVAGEDPNAISAGEQDNSQVSVEVRNGTNTPGAAAQMAEILKSEGFQIGKVGNTDDNTIYPETLIVYTDPSFEAAAKSIISALGAGRAVNGGDFYHSESDVIAIVGSDWSPII